MNAQHPPTRKERFDNQDDRMDEIGRVRGQFTGNGYGPAGAWPDGARRDDDERWGLVVEEPGTGSQCVPDFSKEH